MGTLSLVKGTSPLCSTSYYIGMTVRRFRSRCANAPRGGAINGPTYTCRLPRSGTLASYERRQMRHQSARCRERWGDARWGPSAERRSYGCHFTARVRSQSRQRARPRIGDSPRKCEGHRIPARTNYEVTLRLACGCARHRKRSDGAASVQSAGEPKYHHGSTEGILECPQCPDRERPGLCLRERKRGGFSPSEVQRARGAFVVEGANVRCRRRAARSPHGVQDSRRA